MNGNLCVWEDIVPPEKFPPLEPYSPPVSMKAPIPKPKKNDIESSLSRISLKYRKD